MDDSADTSGPGWAGETRALLKQQLALHSAPGPDGIFWPKQIIVVHSFKMCNFKMRKKWQLEQNRLENKFNLVELNKGLLFFTIVNAVHVPFLCIEISMKMQLARKKVDFRSKKKDVWTLPVLIDFVLFLSLHIFGNKA